MKALAFDGGLTLNNILVKCANCSIIDGVYNPLYNSTDKFLCWNCFDQFRTENYWLFQPGSSLPWIHDRDLPEALNAYYHFISTGGFKI